MNCFDILGISFNSDKKTIKHAYAKLLKKHNPEDDPEGYQRLREAYELALMYSEEYRYDSDSINNNINNIDSYSDFSEENDSDMHESFSIHNNIDEYLNNLDEFYTTEEMISVFVNKLNEIYNNLKLRIDKNAWTKLLNDELLSDPDTSIKLKKIIITFICEHSIIPKDIMIQIDDILKIRDNKSSYLNEFGQTLINNYIDTYNNADKLSYKYMIDINPKYANKYLELRLLIFKLINSENSYLIVSKIEAYYRKAISLYNKDAELYVLMAGYYLKICYTDNALKLYKKVFDIDNYNSEANKKTGEILFNKRDFIHSLEYLEVYIKFSKADMKTQYMMAFSYYYTKQYKKSLAFFNKFIENYGYDENIDLYIKEIQKKINIKYNFTIKPNAIKPIAINSSAIKYDSRKPRKQNFSCNKKHHKISRKVLLWNSIILVIIFILIKSHIIPTKTQKVTPQNSSFIAIENTKLLKNLDDFENISLNTKILISLSDVEELDCYKFEKYKTETLKKETIFMKKQDMIDKNCWNDNHDRIYSGKIGGKRIFFESSKNLNMQLIKNKKYTIMGYASEITPTMFKSLSTFINKQSDYISTKYITTIPTISFPQDYEQLNKDNDIKK